MWEERRGNVRTVTFPCGPLRWTLVNPFGFSHLQEGCRSEGSGQIGKWIGKQQNCSAVIRNTFPCICRAALRLRRLLDDFCFRSAEKCCFRSTSAVSTTTNTSFDQGSLSRISSAVIKAKTQKVTFFLLLFFLFFYQLSVRLEAVTQKMKYPHPCESTVFGWHHSFPTGLSNPALWKGLECAGFILTIDAPEDVFTRPSRASAEILDTFFIYLLFCKYDGVIDLWLVLKRGEEKMQDQQRSASTIKSNMELWEQWEPYSLDRWYLWFIISLGASLFLTRYISVITPLALFHSLIWLHYHRICAPCAPRKHP